MRTPSFVLAVIALAGAAAAPLPGSAPDLPCTTDLDAAVAMVTDQPTVAPTRLTTGGVDIAVVVDPLVAPGIPNALLATDLGLCSVDAFNLVAGPLGGAVSLASGFASVAGMPWLGEVEVRDVAVDGDVVTLTTHGGRHAVTSDWTITVDARGIRDASFVTTDFATGLGAIDLHDWEGITSLPGHGRTWTRGADGLLSLERTIADDLAASIAEREAAAAHAAEVAGLAPGDLLEGDLDGQVVRYTLGFAAPTVETVPTGVDYADRLNYVDRGMDVIFDQYESWGATDVWDGSARTFFGFETVPDEIGYVNFDSPIAAFCLACAFVGDFIEIHQLLAFGEVIESPAFGSAYPDDNSLALEVVGHEFTHAVQGGYGDGNVGLTNAFYEATAVASQALFHEAENSNQVGSLEYGDNGNACNGFENGRGTWIDAQAAGPFLDGHTYDACYFWWTFVAEHGGEGLVALMEALPAVGALDGEQIDRHLLQLDLASPIGDRTVELSRWAAAYTAGTSANGYTIVDGSGDALEWFGPLGDAERSRTLSSGDTLDVSLFNGGTAGFSIAEAGTLSRLPSAAKAYVWRIEDRQLVLVGPASRGMAVQPGDLLALVAPGADVVDGTVALD